MKHFFAILFALVLSAISTAQTETWTGQHDTENIEVTLVYFVPADRQPLPDWRERVDYYCRRIELFHTREFQGQSNLNTAVMDEPLVSRRTTAELRRGDANAIYFRTLGEADERLEFARGERTAFPILLVLSEINWRPLDDFYRLKPQGDAFVFEGNYTRGGHFPGARSGGARASYLSDRGVGWGLVSADGWRVPYRGSDCVIYHEGCGHTVGLPHPEPQDGSVMSLGQYRGWLSESWLDRSQKERLGWNAEDVQEDPQIELFSQFRALPQPPVPQPGQAVFLQLNWPEGAKLKTLRVRFQTSVEGPWIEWPQSWEEDLPEVAKLPKFDRPTPVSYRVDAELESGAKAELWGYFQVRAAPNECPQPQSLSPDLIMPSESGDAILGADRLASESIDLLQLANPEECWTVGPWSREDGKLLSPKRFGARLEVPYSPPEQYRLVMVVEPLDEPDGLILGQVLGGQRFVTLFNYTPRERALSAIEDVDGRNVGNSTTFTGDVLRKDVLSQVIVTVKRRSVTMSVDGRTIVAWEGTPDRLSLSDYWSTPDASALILGTYDCRYRFHRITLEPISGQGKLLTTKSP